MKKIFLLYTIVLLITSCDSKNTLSDISGNWSTSSPKKLDNNTIDYAEIFIRNDTLYVCSELMLRMSPKKVTLTKDSLFISLNGKVDFIGKILKHSQNSFELGINNENKRIYKRIKSKNNLENMIGGKISEKEYYNTFFERMNKTYKTIDN